MESNKLILEMSEAPAVDLLMCGSCKRTFELSNIQGFMKHKKFDCEDPGNLADPKNKTLLCQACHQKFNTPWSLLKHAQNVHFLQIYLEQNYGIQSLQVLDDPAIKPPSLGMNAISLTQTHICGNLSTTEDIDSTDKIQSGPEPTLKDASKPASAELASSEPTLSELVSSEPASVKPDSSQMDATTSNSTESEVDDNEVNVKQVPLKTATVDMAGKTRRKTSESATQTLTKVSSSSDTENKEGGSFNEDQKCCDDQDCGITVMPGTHESLKKCCSAVLPKKRKRHMEIKHRISALARLRRQRMRSNSPASIFIDVAPDSGGFTSQTLSTEKVTGTKNKTGDLTIHATSNSTNPRLHSLCSSIKQKSVIIQPGSTFSIPVSYAVGSLPPAIRIIGSDFQRAISSAASSGMKLLSTTAHSTVLPSSIATVKLASESENSMVTGQNSSSEDSKYMESTTISPDLSVIQGMIGQIFSEKTASSAAMSDHDIAADELSLMDDSGATMSEQSDSLMSFARDFRGKKRRYPTSRPYKCDQCDNAFNQRIHLKKHQSKHTGIKPFKCDQCDYATVERSHLKVHIRVHTGEKPFKCTYCEYATAQKSTLKIHLKRHHSTTEHCFQCTHRENTPCFPSLDHTQLLLNEANNESVMTMEHSTSTNNDLAPMVEHTPLESDLALTMAHSPAVNDTVMAMKPNPQSSHNSLVVIESSADNDLGETIAPIDLTEDHVPADLSDVTVTTDIMKLQPEHNNKLIDQKH